MKHTLVTRVVECQIFKPASAEVVMDCPLWSLCKCTISFITVIFDCVNRIIISLQASSLGGSD